MAKRAAFYAPSLCSGPEAVEAFESGKIKAQRFQQLYRSHLFAALFRSSLRVARCAPIAFGRAGGVAMLGNILCSLKESGRSGKSGKVIEKHVSFLHRFLYRFTAFEAGRVVEQVPPARPSSPPFPKRRARVHYAHTYARKGRTI